MARKIHRSQIEIYVEGYLRKYMHSHNLRKERKFLEKTKVLINLVLDSPCCENPLAETDLITFRDNAMTRTVHALLLGIDRRRHRKSLERTIDILDKFIDDPCCI